MADPQAGLLTQLKNIQARTGRTIAELHAAVGGAGLARHGEKRSWLMEHFGLGHGDANTVVHFIDKPLPDLGGGAPAAAPATAAADPLDALYSGGKAQGFKICFHEETPKCLFLFHNPVLVIASAIVASCNQLSTPINT